MSKQSVPPQIQQREAAFKKKLAKQRAEPLGSIPRPAPAVPTIVSPAFPDPMKGKK